MGTPTDRDALEKRLKDKINVLDNGCHKWYIDTNGNIVKSSTKLEGKNVSYYVHSFLYEQLHSTRLTDRKFYLKRTCNMSDCVNPEHYVLHNKKRPETKEDTWKRLLSHSHEVDDHIVWNRPSLATSFRGDSVTAHRISYIIHNNNMDPIPTHNEHGEMLVIRHKCTVKNCINPHHLEIGTASENSFEDMNRDGTLMRGEKSSSVKITKELASKIKLSRLKKGEPLYKTQKQRSEEFGVSLSTIIRIDSGNSWGYLLDRNGKPSPDKRKQHQKYKNKARVRVWTSQDYEAIIPMLRLQVEYTSENKKDPSVEGDCWEFSGFRNSRNYGKKSYLGLKSYTHILACESKNERRIQPGEVTRHLCGNHPCCNPQHLEFGTRIENSLDTLKHNGITILKEDDVLAIRASDESGTILGKRYGVAKTTIYDVKKRKSWKHI